MSFGGSVAAMITSLKSNNSLRPRRDRLFDKDIRGIKIKNGRKVHGSYKHLSKKEILEIRKELSEKNKIDNLKKITALIISIIITGVIIVLFLNYFNFDLLGKDFVH